MNQNPCLQTLAYLLMILIPTLATWLLALQVRLSRGDTENRTLNHGGGLM